MIFPATFMLSLGVGISFAWPKPERLEAPWSSPLQAAVLNPRHLQHTLRICCSFEQNVHSQEKLHYKFAFLRANVGNFTVWIGRSGAFWPSLQDYDSHFFYWQFQTYYWILDQVERIWFQSRGSPTHYNSSFPIVDVPLQYLYWNFKITFDILYLKLKQTIKKRRSTSRDLLNH